MEPAPQTPVLLALCEEILERGRRQDPLGTAPELVARRLLETLELARLPCRKGLSPEAYREHIAEVVREVEEASIPLIGWDLFAQEPIYRAS